MVFTHPFPGSIASFFGAPIVPPSAPDCMSFVSHSVCSSSSVALFARHVSVAPPSTRSSSFASSFVHQARSFPSDVCFARLSHVLVDPFFLELHADVSDHVVHHAAVRLHHVHLAHAASLPGIRACDHVDARAKRCLLHVEVRVVCLDDTTGTGHHGLPPQQWYRHGLLLGKNARVFGGEGAACAEEEEEKDRVDRCLWRSKCGLSRRGDGRVGCRRRRRTALRGEMARLTPLHRRENAHESGCWSVCWASEDRFVLSGSMDETVKQWTVEEPGRLEDTYTYPEHSLGVVSVASAPEENVVASSSLDSSIRVWNVEKFETYAVLANMPSETWGIQFSPNAQSKVVAAASGSLSGVSVWNYESGEKISSMQLPPVQDTRHQPRRFALSIAFSPDGKRIACSAMDGTVAAFDLDTQKLLHVFEGHNMPVRGLAFLPDGATLCTASDDAQIHMYDSNSGKLMDTLSGHESWALSLAVHPDGAYLASGSSDRSIKLWDVRSRSCIQTVMEHKDQVWGIQFSKAGKHLASVSDDKSIGLYSFQ